MESSYQKMWEDFGRSKGQRYLDYKFTPTHRVGLTNYLREQLVSKLLEPQKSELVLDAGCASGRQLFQIADKIKAGYGTDIAQSFIERANQTKSQERIGNLFFQQAPVEDLPFADIFFDKIICAEVLEHVSDKDEALHELLRVLKKGGILIITVPNLNADGTWWGRWLRLMRFRKFRPFRHFSETSITDHGDAHVREFETHSLQAWLLRQGLEVLAARSVSFLDGPGFDFLLKFPLHLGFLQKLIIKFEQWLTNLGLFWGRHLVVKTRKK